MNDQAMTRARKRIAARQGKLTGWRPITIGDIAIVAVQVLGVVNGDRSTIGLSVVVAARTADLIENHGRHAAERALRKRAVLADLDAFDVVHAGTFHDGNGDSDDLLQWPWRALTIHVPERQLPAISGLATDTVPTP